MVDIEPRSAEWAKNPEPSLPTMDPQVILDANLERTVWLYNYDNEATEWLTYHGEPEPLSR